MVAYQDETWESEVGGSGTVVGCKESTMSSTRGWVNEGWEDGKADGRSGRDGGRIDRYWIASARDMYVLGVMTGYTRAQRRRLCGSLSREGGGGGEGGGGRIEPEGG